MVPDYNPQTLANKASEDSKGMNKNPQHKEGPVARSIEEQTAKLPSDIFLWVGIGFMAISLGLQIAGKKKVSNFIGHWPTNILIMGLYNKLVKLEGHD